MRILLLTDNYPPETNASALRSSAHAKRWREKGAEVTVITSYPNFPEGKLYQGYRQRLYSREDITGVDVLRVPTLIFPNVGFFKRIIDFLSYMVSASIAALFVKKPDVVVATSPQFFTAVAGWIVSVTRRVPFVFELRDIWPDSIIAVGIAKESLAIQILRKLEYFLYRRASLIVAVTEAFRTHLINNGIRADKIAVVRNGVDLAKFSPGQAPFELREQLGLQNKTVASYIGTIGMAHGLEILLEIGERLKTTKPELQFLVVGAGAGLEPLRDGVRARSLTNFSFVDRVTHDEVLNYWRLSDMALVVLRDDPVFRTVIPSKIFEAMATGTPIITNVAGELDTLLKPLGNAVHVEPGNAAALEEAISALADNPAQRQALSRAGIEAAPQFQREACADAMLELLETIASTKTA